MLPYAVPIHLFGVIAVEENFYGVVINAILDNKVANLLNVIFFILCGREY